MNKEYFINEEKKTIVCVYTTPIGVFRGKSKCLADDVWDEARGKDIAQIRAEIKYTVKQTKILNKAHKDMLIKGYNINKKITKTINHITDKNNAYMDQYFDLREELCRLIG